MNSPTKEDIRRAIRCDNSSHIIDQYIDLKYAYLEAVEALQEVRKCIYGMDEWHIHDFDIRDIDAILEKAPEVKDE
jgi:hypothetical protein